MSRAHLQAKWHCWMRSTPGMRAEALRRRDAVLMVQRLVGEGVGRMEAYGIVARRWGRSVSTVRNWVRLVKRAERGDYLPLLLPRYRGRVAFAEYEPSIDRIFRGLYIMTGRRNFAHCYRVTAASAARRKWWVPSLATLIRRYQRSERVFRIAG